MSADRGHIGAGRGGPHAPPASPSGPPSPRCQGQPECNPPKGRQPARPSPRWCERRELTRDNSAPASATISAARAQPLFSNTHLVAGQRQHLSNRTAHPPHRRRRSHRPQIAIAGFWKPSAAFARNRIPCITRPAERPRSDPVVRRAQPPLFTSGGEHRRLPVTGTQNGVHGHTRSSPRRLPATKALRRLRQQVAKHTLYPLHPILIT